MARQRRIVSGRRRAANCSWSGVGSTAFTTVAASTSVVVGSFTLFSAGIDETVLRSVGVLSIGSDQSAAIEAQVGAFGMIVVSDAALAAGIASLPTPVTEIDNDGWLLYVPFAQQTERALGSPSSVEYHFDSKAKRVVEGGSVIAIVLENSHATHGLQFALVMRMLSMVRGT